MSRFLVVDDNVQFAENLAEILSDAGDEAVVADCGRRALELASRDRFDAIVSDMRMPEMSGSEVVRRLREIDAGLPAVIVTAYHAEQDELARHAGVLGVLPKPVPMPRLISLLHKARRDGVVAIIDDDQALVDNLSEILREHGFAPISATSLEEAEALGAVQLFAAIVDLRLPGGPDGEALRRLAARFPSLPLLLATGYPDVVVPVELHVRLTKPVAPASLVGELAQLHAAHHAH